VSFFHKIFSISSWLDVDNRKRSDRSHLRRRRDSGDMGYSMGGSSYQDTKRQRVNGRFKQDNPTQKSFILPPVQKFKTEWRMVEKFDVFSFIM